MNDDAGEPQTRDAWVVQLTSDGIPEPPEVYFDRATAVQTYAEYGLRYDLIFDPGRGDFDNSEAHHVEVRLYQVEVPYQPAGPVDVTAEQRAEAAKIAPLVRVE
jgi:hypothetical protein